MAKQTKKFKPVPHDKPMPKDANDREMDQGQLYVSDEVPKELRPKGAKVFNGKKGFKK